MGIAEKEMSLDVSTLSFEGVTALLGDPEIERFRLSNDVSEFRIELLNYYTVAELVRNQPPITQATYFITADRNLTVWYRETAQGPEYLHQMDWRPGQEF